MNNLIINNDKLLTPTDVSVILGVDVETLNVWRCNRRYPLPYVKIGRSVRYKADDVASFIEQQRISHSP